MREGWSLSRRRHGRGGKGIQLVDEPKLEGCNGFSGKALDHILAFSFN